MTTPYQRRMRPRANTIRATAEQRDEEQDKRQARLSARQIVAGYTYHSPYLSDSRRTIIPPDADKFDLGKILG